MTERKKKKRKKKTYGMCGLRSFIHRRKSRQTALPAWQPRHEGSDHGHIVNDLGKPWTIEMHMAPNTSARTVTTERSRAYLKRGKCAVCLSDRKRQQLCEGVGAPVVHYAHRHAERRHEGV
ncbi:hypothetical protein GGTG_03893 [Gaeumannomyces tritici R3-111a-1]|uniref:Uncharacterized protein n=1 Tax=Gaeumannomyces tritici (strain R3-111a-1) TaxID=644352 RepID=J3NRI9_GAET3|nr:hypothetical protein GGTG_03893 [Gaeumannomyces tritici R3-111a-1]EJT78795.1 hypothetical protein GGTG_03893 [Gaeumannomyces tritici R3-111a-1]